jgi:hypothetical protein
MLTMLNKGLSSKNMIYKRGKLIKVSLYRRKAKLEGGGGFPSIIKTLLFFDFL